MSKTLNFNDELLSMGRHWQRLGFWSRAQSLCERLCAQPGLSPNHYQEAQDVLAEVAECRDETDRVTRHRTASLCLDPEDGGRHYQLGLALQAEGKCDLALAHFRLAVKFDASRAEHHYALGLAALRAGNSDEALSALHRAAERAADEPKLLGQVLAALIDADQPGEARSLALRARFRHRRDRRFEQLWQDVQYRITAQRQAEAEEPVLLPFTVSESALREFRLDGQIFRIDDAESRRAPLRGQRSKQRRP